MTERPVRSADLERVVNGYSEMSERGRGRLVIVSGPDGSGRTELLQTADQTLKGVKQGGHVFAGEVDVDDGFRYCAWNEEERPWKKAFAVIQTLLAVGGRLEPILGFVAQVLAAELVTSDFLAKCLPKKRDNPGAVLADVLKEAMSDQPIAWLIDNADRGLAGLWVELEFNLAAQIASELPLLLVLATQDREGEPTGQDEANAQKWARHFVEDGRAERLVLEPFEHEDVERWLGRASRELIEHLLEVTWGRAGLLQELWAQWTRAGVVARAPEDGRWEFSALADPVAPMPRRALPVLGGVAHALRAHVEAVTGSQDADVLHSYNRLLWCGALEGRRFTAEATAAALGRDRDEVIRALDEVLAKITPMDTR